MNNNIQNVLCNSTLRICEPLSSKETLSYREQKKRDVKYPCGHIQACFLAVKTASWNPATGCGSVRVSHDLQLAGHQ